jgi:hypothetical protein
VVLCYIEEKEGGVFMRYRFVRFPGGKSKAITFSYDDGVRDDLHFTEIIDRYGLKATFNVNTDLIPTQSGELRLTAEELLQMVGISTNWPPTVHCILLPAKPLLWI